MSAVREGSKMIVTVSYVHLEPTWMSDEVNTEEADNHEVARGAIHMVRRSNERSTEVRLMIQRVTSLV